MHCGSSGVFRVFTPLTKRNVFTVFIKYVQIKTKYLVLNILDEFVKPEVIIKLYLVLLYYLGQIPERFMDPLILSLLFLSLHFLP